MLWGCKDAVRHRQLDGCAAGEVMLPPRTACKRCKHTQGAHDVTTPGGWQALQTTGALRRAMLVHACFLMVGGVCILS